MSVKEEDSDEDENISNFACDDKVSLLKGKTTAEKRAKSRKTRKETLLKKVN